MADKKNNGVVDKAEMAVIDEQSIRDKIYVVRGVQVMLDFGSRVPVTLKIL